MGSAICHGTLDCTQRRGREELNVLPKYDDSACQRDEYDILGIDLAKRAAAGDQEAFTEIYHQHINRVYGLCLRLTTDQVKAEILAQDVFVKAWTSLGSYSGRGSLAGWLGRLTVNLWRDRFRYQVRQDKLLKEAALSWEYDRPANGSVVPMLTAMDLERSLKKLPKGARTVFVLHEIEGYKHHH